MSALMMTSAAGAASTTSTYVNSDPIYIAQPQPLGSCEDIEPAPASTYPSTLAVPGPGAALEDVNVTVALAASRGSDVGLLLVGPTGQSVTLMTDSGYDYPSGGALFGSPGNEVLLTFDDEAAGPVPVTASMATGSYTPSAANGEYNGCARPDTFPAPAPTSATATALAAFDGTDPAGEWSLYAITDYISTATIREWQLDLTVSGHSYSVSTFRAPIKAAPRLNVAKAGRTIPLKFTVTDETGSPVSDLTPGDVSVVVELARCSCGRADGPSTSYSADGRLHSLRNGSYLYRLTTPKAWAGRCGTLTLTAGGATRAAEFRFRS